MRDPRPTDEAVARAVGEEFPLEVVVSVAEDWSTYVYSARRANEVFYVRVLPEAHSTLVPEATAHNELRRLGVAVPEVVHVVERHPQLGLSLMVTREMPGQAVGHGTRPWHHQDVIVEAGRQLALFHQVEVPGVGWIQREPAIAHLEGEFATQAEWMSEELGAHAERAAASTALTARERALLESVIREWAHHCEGDSVLVHGDFDVSHVFHDNGSFTGFIDLGEIRA